MPLADKEVTLEHEKLLWDTKELDLDTSKGLLRAVIFYLIKCFAIWQCKELRQLQTSHVAFDENKHGKFVALDLQSSIFKRKRFVKRYDDPANPRSVYKILKKYRSRIANEGPFLVRPISSIKDFVCFGPLPLGIRLIKTFVSNLMEDAGIGRCFVNYSLNLQSVGTLRRFGTGFHCLSPWLVKNSTKSFSLGPECGSSNCEDLNPEVSVMISRLLDAPYPFNAVDIIQKMEHQEQQKHPEKSPTFDSWMTNLMEDEDKELDKKPELPVSTNPSPSEETDKEVHLNQGSGCKVLIVSTEEEEEKSCDDDSCEPTGSCSGTLNDQAESFRLKIATVSSISEGAFSLQVDEGNHIGERNKCNTDQNHATADSDRGKSVPGKSKKRKNISRTENDSEEVAAKVSKFDHCNKTSSCEPSPELQESDSGGGVCLGSCSSKTESNVHSKPEPDHEKDMMSKSPLEPHKIDNDLNSLDHSLQTVHKVQPKCVEVSLTNSTSKSQNSSEKQTSDSQNKQILSLSSRTISSSPKVNLPHPDSSRDSITILRRLLGNHSDDELPFNLKMSGRNSCRNVMNEHSSEKNKTDTCKGDDETKPSTSQCLGDIKAEKQTNEEEEGTVLDLSPPTLSPQPPTCIPQAMDDTVDPNRVATPDGLTPASSNQCAPSLVPMSSDIVQFLDKAHQQIKNILNSTASKTDSHNVNRESSLKSKPLKQKDIQVPFKHSRKSKKPVKIINSVSSCETSPKKDIVFEESLSISSPLSSKLPEQSQPDFPLLRLFLERPIEETEIVMASRNTLNTPKEDHKSKNTLLPSISNSFTPSLSEPPKLTFMGNATTTCPEAVDCEDSKCHSEPTCSELNNVKKKKGQTDCSALSEDKRECPRAVSPISLSSSVPSSPASPFTTGGDSPGPNTAVYRAEKDLLNNAVYQSLKVNYEKDGVRTFTFADIPNVSQSASHSKRFRNRKQTSEINLGDYFPPGTLIPAKNIHLVTQQGPEGCDIVMKFSISPKD